MYILSYMCVHIYTHIYNGDMYILYIQDLKLNSFEPAQSKQESSQIVLSNFLNHDCEVLVLHQGD